MARTIVLCWILAAGLLIPPVQDATNRLVNPANFTETAPAVFRTLFDTNVGMFVIEVHRAEFIERLQATFRSRGLALDLVEQQPLPILGREERDADNWWLVSRLERR